MPYALQIIVCQATSCRTEIVLPFLAPVQNSPLVTSIGDDPYLNVACPRCSHVFRYASAQSRQRVSDTPNPYQPPASVVWFRVLLKCDGTACNSRIKVESAMTNGAIDEGLKNARFTLGGRRRSSQMRLWAPSISTAGNDVGRNCMPRLEKPDSRLSPLKLCSFDVVSTDLLEARVSSHRAALHLRIILLLLLHSNARIQKFETDRPVMAVRTPMR